MGRDRRPPRGGASEGIFGRHRAGDRESDRAGSAFGARCAVC